MTTIQQTSSATYVNYTDMRMEGADHLSAPASLLQSATELFHSGDPGAALAALAIAMGREEQRSAELLKNSAARLEVAEQDAQLDSLHQKAVIGLVSGIASGVLSASSAAASGVGSIKSAKAEAVGVGKPEAGAGSIKSAEAEAVGVREAEAAKLRIEAAKAKVLGSALGVASKLPAVGLDYAAASHDVDATRHAQGASRARTQVDALREHEGDAGKLVDRALDFLKEYQATKAETIAVAARRA